MKYQEIADQLQISIKIVETHMGKTIGGILQMAGLINHTNGTVAGLMNTAKSVNGIQFGLINRAETSAYPIGLLNFVKKAGHKTIGMTIDESCFNDFLENRRSKDVWPIGVGVCSSFSFLRF